MKKFRKIITLVLALCLLFSAAGCKKTEKTSSEGDVMVIDWVPQNDNPVDENSPVKLALEEKFGVKFNFIYLDRSKEAELMNIRIASKQIPDVMRKSVVQAKGFVDQGVISEIPEELIKTVAPTYYDVTKKNGGDDIWDITKIDGKTYILPSLNINGQYHFVNIWRDDWLKNVGIDKIPETIDEAEEAFYKFVKNDPDGNGKNDTYAISNTGINAVLAAYDAYPYDMFWTVRDNKVVLGAVVPEMKEALKKLHKWYEDGLIDPEFITGENRGQAWSNSVSFWNGKIGFAMPGMFYHVSPPLTETSKGSVNYQNFKSLQGENATYIEGKPLKGPNGNMGSIKWGVGSGNGGVVIGRNVEPGSAKMKKILEINEALNADYETYELAVSGIEGLNYEVDSNGNKVMLLSKEESKNMGLSSNGIVYLANNFEFARKEPQSELSFSYADRVSNYTDNYTNDVWVGLPSDLKYNATIDAKVDENYIAFITGARDIEEFDKFVDELYKAGLGQLTKEANDWYKKTILSK